MTQTDKNIANIRFAHDTIMSVKLDIQDAQDEECLNNGSLQDEFSNIMELIEKLLVGIDDLANMCQLRDNEEFEAMLGILEPRC